MNKDDFPAVMYGPPGMFFRPKRRKRIEVVAAVLRQGDAILATQRGYGEWKGYWEFPGGKVKNGETYEEALRRELLEEMDAEIEIEELFTTIEYDYPDFHLTMHCYFCHLQNDHYTLKEHTDARWLTHDTIHSVQWLPADEGILDFLF